MLETIHFSKVCVAVLLLLLYSTTDGHYNHRLYVRAIMDLTYLERFELQVAQELIKATLAHGKLNESPEIRRMVEEYLRDFLTGNGFRKMKDILSIQETLASKNPICTYRLIRRVAFLLKELVSHKYFSTMFGDLSRGINRFFIVNGWPKNEDVEDTITAIIRNQHIFDLSAEQLANGLISTVQTNCTLNSIHCYEISKTALKIGRFSSAIEWLELAKVKSWVDGKLDIALIGSSTWNAVEMHNEAFRTAKNWETQYFNRVIDHASEDYKAAEKRRTVQYNAFKGNKDKRYSEINYWGLCAGDNLQSDAEKAHLFCWYEFKIHPRYTMGPVKMEFLARDPDVVQMYEVIREEEIQEIILESSPRLRESLVLNINKDNTSTKDQVSLASAFRTSVNGWFDDSINTISGRIESLTGLHVIKRTAAEQLQVASYSFAGHYVPHVDSLVDPKEMGPSGDRIATFMFYFNDVELGGGTAFTSSGVLANPRKGSAVFWYDLYTDGSTDYNSYHGACPVLLGEKWVGNKWIRVNDQLLTRKCSLNPKERFQVPVNNMYLPIPTIPKSDTENKPTSAKVHPVESTMLNKYSYLNPHGLKALAQLEWTIYRNVKQFYDTYSSQPPGLTTQAFKNFSNGIKMYLQDFEETTIKLIGSELPNHDPAKLAEKVAWNPLTSYHMVARFLAYIQPWLNDSFSGQNQLMTRMNSYLNQVYKRADGPHREDFNTAMFAIINIHYMYDLSAKNIAEGYLDGLSTGIILKASDCYLIGKFAITLKYFTIGIEWLEYALYLVEMKFDVTVEHEDAFVELVTAAIVHDKEHAKTIGYEPKFFDKPINQVSQPEVRLTRKAIQYEAFNMKTETNFAEINFWGICEGKSHQTDQEKSRLFCWYEHTIHPSFLISPVKSELHSAFPKIEIVQYHDIINDEIIKALENVTYSNLVRATTVKNVPGDRVLDARKRQGVHGWISEKESEAALKVSKLIERITSLRVVNTVNEDLQIAGYTPGSYYTVHTDTYSFGEKERTRVATFMLYLSDVEKGGDTAFVQAGVKVKPEKGSAVFWFNQLASGRLEDLTWHGACPVILGEKWVANKWIHYENQEHLQCDTHPLTAFEVLVNGESKYL